MKHGILVLSMIVTCLAGQCQNMDSLLAQPQTPELTISTPQPRLNESFTLTLDINHIRANIFRSLAGKVRLANGVADSNNGDLVMNVLALKKGKTEIGPLEFNVNGTKYTTAKIAYEVIDALPNTDKGLWFRKVNINDSVFCIIIDQRIPAHGKKTESGNSFTLSTEAETTEIAGFKPTYSIEGLSGRNSNSRTDYSSIYDAKGVQKQFLSAFSIYYFTINDRTLKIKITKDKFEHLPADYNFTDIIVQ